MILVWRSWYPTEEYCQFYLLREKHQYQLDTIAPELPNVNGQVGHKVDQAAVLDVDDSLPSPQNFVVTWRLPEIYSYPSIFASAFAVYPLDYYDFDVLCCCFGYLLQYVSGNRFQVHSNQTRKRCSLEIQTRGIFLRSCYQYLKMWLYRDVARLSAGKD